MTMTEQAPAEIPTWTLGDRIARARRHARLEQVDLAATMGVSRQMVSKWERDEREPKPSQVERIAEATRVSYGWLVGADPRSRCFISPAALPDGEQLQLALDARPPQLQLVLTH